MALKYNGGNRKLFRLTETEAAQATEFARISGTSLSGLIRSWIEGYADDVASDATPTPTEPMVNVQVVVAPETVLAAEKKLPSGVTLREAIRHEITQLSDL